MPTELRAGADDDGRRLDRILRKALPQLPLSALHRLLRQGRVLVDGRRARPEDRIPAGAAILIPELPPGDAGESREPGKPPPPLPPILFEGPGILILNKPVGLASHGEGGLDALVRSYLAPHLPPSLSFRPGPLHRLDKPTSGIIAFSKSLPGARRFSALLREGRIKKYYLALAAGILGGPEIWEDDLVRDRGLQKTFPAGPRSGPEGEKPQNALTRVRPLACAPGYTLLLAEIATGRTHQIRAQAAARGHPLAGDRKYGELGQGPFFLHAWKLEFGPGAEDLALPPLIVAPPPEAFLRRIRAVFPPGGKPGQTLEEFLRKG